MKDVWNFIHLEIIISVKSVYKVRVVFVIIEKILTNLFGNYYAALVNVLSAVQIFEIKEPIVDNV